AAASSFTRSFRHPDHLVQIEVGIAPAIHARMVIAKLPLCFVALAGCLAAEGSPPAVADPTDPAPVAFDVPQVSITCFETGNFRLSDGTYGRNTFSRSYQV